jgi:hypothetical protein
MLLIGSRAIVRHFPDFRPPVDWDLVGTDEDIARLAAVLPRIPEKPRRDKAHFKYGDVLVEVANASTIPYWAHAMELFKDEPTLEDPVLGSMHLAPPSFLLLTKQCGLIYHALHWHKNLEDLYFLRDRIPRIPDRVAALIPETLADSRRMFAEPHAAVVRAAAACHPESPPPRDRQLHAELHEQLALGTAPLVRREGAWQAFPEAHGEQKRDLMIQLFAEEAMVVAAEQLLMGDLTEDEGKLTRWALRSLITGRLPEAWRYFGVNHYREIRDRIPHGWTQHLKGLLENRPDFQTCTSVSLGNSAPCQGAITCRG